MSNLEFGMDSGVVGSLQAVPGWLMVFGYPDKFIPGGFGLDVSTGPMSVVYRPSLANSP